MTPTGVATEERQEERVPGKQEESTLQEETASASRDLLRYRPVSAVLRHRLFPGILHWAAAAVFVLASYELLLGPSSAHDNFGTAVMWVIWWPLIPIAFVFLGRFWCAICPFGTLTDFVQRHVGAQRPVPRWLKKNGIWVIDASFLLITWADHVWGVVESPLGSGVLVLLLTTAAVASGVLLPRRAFCRYLCFLGGLSGNYARSGMLRLRATPKICKTCTSRAACYNGTKEIPGCPLFEMPRTMDSSANCNLCARCIKNCPNDSITLTLQPPTKELWFIRKPKLEVSFLAMAIMGIVLIQNLTMLNVWSSILDGIDRVTGVKSYPVVFTFAFVVAVGAPVALLAAASWAAGRFNRTGTWKNFTRFGYALIPLDMAAHIAHNLFHLLGEGKAVVTTGAALLGSTSASTSAAFVGPDVIRVLQFSVLFLGVIGSLYTTYRIAGANHTDGESRVGTFAPYVALLGVLTALNVWMFALPMAHRM